MNTMIKIRTTSLRGTKQSRSNSEHSGLTLDCFAPLAMTALRKQSRKSHINYKTGHTDYKSARAEKPLTINN